MPRKSNSVFYVGASVLLIMVAIAATAIVSQTKPNENSAEIRAKAGVSATLKTIGTVSSIDTTSSTLVVNDLRFVESTGEVSNQSLGSWTVTPPLRFNLATLIPGTTITITISPQTFLTASHTVTATQITIER